MATLSTLSTPIATKMVNEDGTINHVWNEFFVRLMVSAGVTVDLEALQADVDALETAVDALETEVIDSITLTDSDGTIASTLAKLYDGNKSSDGLEYTVSGTDKYIQYEFGLREFVDRVSIYAADANGRAYVGYSDDGTAWSYLKAEADHTTDSDGKLLSATNLADAQTNYLQLAAGTNIALFPNNITAKFCRLFLIGSYSTTIYELIFARIIIAEMATIQNLAALSATFGPVGGYAEITDAPQTADIVDFATTESSNVLRTGNTILKTGVNGWDGQSYSDNGHIGGARLSFNPNQIDAHIMLGLNIDPTTDANYTGIDYCFYCVSGGDLFYYESGAGATLGVTYAIGDLLEIVYTGAQIVYYKNGVSLRTVVVTIANALYMDSSFYHIGGEVSNVRFGAYASNHSTWEDSSDPTLMDASNLTGAMDLTGNGFTTIVGDVISVFGDTIEIEADVNDKLDWIENSTTEVATLTASAVYTATTLAAHIQVIMRAQGDANTTVTYSSTTLKITIANSTLTTLSLLWNSGTNTAITCGPALGFDVTSDDTGALTYLADREAALRVLLGDLG